MMGWKSWATCGLLAVVLSACGGGGGGGDDGGGGFSVSYDRRNVEFSFDQYGSVAPAVVEATARGTPSGNVYLGASTPSGNPDPNILSVEVDVHGSSGATVRIHPNFGLPPGTYTGTVLLLVCADEYCTKQYAGSPYSLNYTIRVKAGIGLDPNFLSYTGMSGESHSQVVRVTLPPDATSFSAVPRDNLTTIDQVTASSFRVTTMAPYPGTYSTAVIVSAGNHQRELGVELQARKHTLQVENANLSFGAVSGTPATAEVKVTQLAEGEASYTVESADFDPARWLSVTDLTPQGFKLQALSMPPGPYETRLRLRSGTDQVVVAVRYTVTPAPTGTQFLKLGASSLTLVAAEGGTATASLPLTRPSWNPAEVTAEASYLLGTPGWLSVVVPASGDIQVKANAVGLAKGYYQARLTVNGAWPSVPVEVPVALTVGDGLATPAPQTVVADSESTAASLKGSIPVVANGADAGTWSASTSSPWLKLSATTGSLGSPIGYQIDIPALLALPAYTDVQATVTIQGRAAGTPLGAPGFTPVNATVTLRRELAELRYAGPGTVVAGPNSTSVILRGRGLGRSPDPAARVSIAGITPRSVIRVNDSTLKLDLDLSATGAGDYPISVSNALGVSSSTTLHVRQPQAHTAAAVPSGGEYYSVVYDAAHQQVFAANKGLSAVQRLRESAGVWSKDTLAFARLNDIGLSPDGAVLVVTETNGRLHLVDPVAFTVTESFTVAGQINNSMYTGHGHAITNDGKVWLSVGASLGQWADMVSFDLQSKTFTTVQPPNLVTTFHGGPWFEMSRNGERVVAVQSASTTPAPLALYMDASVGEWKENPAGLQFFYWPVNGLDDTGERFMSNSTVYDRNFAVVGRVTVPSGWFVSAAQLSPDGRRVYAYAVPNTWPTYSGLPNLYVFDSSVAAGTVTDLPLLGRIELSDDPGCRTSAYGENCLHPMMNAAPDGKTLFIAGAVKLLVVPVPATLVTTSQSTRPGREVKLWIGAPAASR